MRCFLTRYPTVFVWFIAHRDEQTDAMSSCGYQLKLDELV